MFNHVRAHEYVIYAKALGDSSSQGPSAAQTKWPLVGR